MARSMGRACDAGLNRADLIGAAGYAQAAGGANERLNSFDHTVGHRKQ